MVPHSIYFYYLIILYKFYYNQLNSIIKKIIIINSIHYWSYLPELSELIIFYYYSYSDSMLW